MNQAWECPRCKRINAPFNPSCFCKPEDDDSAESLKSSQKSDHVMDAVNYLTNPPGSKIADLPNGYKRLINQRCLICNGVHYMGQSCATLQNNLPNDGKFI
jgi:hypothetical protein